MSEGPGKYDAVCTYARQVTQAQAVVLIVLNGVSGAGFSVQSTERVPPAVLADLLRFVADKIEKESA
jgi:hypothetical protein